MFKIILSIFKKKKNKENIYNPSISIYLNKIENRITLKIKTGHCLEVLTPATMGLLRSTENKITKDKNSESIIIINKIQEFCTHSFLTNHLVVY